MRANALVAKKEVMENEIHEHFLRAGDSSVLKNKKWRNSDFKCGTFIHEARFQQ